MDEYEGYLHQVKHWKTNEEQPRVRYEFFHMPTGNRYEHHSKEELLELFMGELDKGHLIRVYHAIDRFRGTNIVDFNEIRRRSPSLQINREDIFLIGESELLASLQEMAIDRIRKDNLVEAKTSSSGD